MGVWARGVGRRCVSVDVVIGAIAAIDRARARDCQWMMAIAGRSAGPSWGRTRGLAQRERRVVETAGVDGDLFQEGCGRQVIRATAGKERAGGDAARRRSPVPARATATPPG